MTTGFPENPEDGTVVQLSSGLFYIYELASNAWVRAEGGFTTPLATPLRDGLMAATDLQKLNQLVLPPPQTTIRGDCNFSFDTGVIALTGDEFITISGTADLVGPTETTEVSRTLHEHSHSFDFTLDKTALLDWLIANDKFKVRASKGPNGPQGEQGAPGKDSLLVGPDGPKGEPGINSKTGLTFANESIPFELKQDYSRALVSIETEEINDDENYLVVTRANMGNPDACPTKVVVQDATNSPWLVAFADNSTSTNQQSRTLDFCGTCNDAIYYVDIGPIVTSIRDKFWTEADRVKRSTQDIVAFWLTNMNDLFDEQKAALCCALEYCRSRSRNLDTRRYLESQRIQAIQANYRPIVSDGRSEYLSTKIVRTAADYTFAGPPLEPVITNLKVTIGGNCEHYGGGAIHFKYRLQSNTAVRLQAYYGTNLFIDTGCSIGVNEFDNITPPEDGTAYAYFSYVEGDGADGNPSSPNKVTVVVSNCPDAINGGIEPTKPGDGGSTITVGWSMTAEAEWTTQCGPDRIETGVCDVDEDGVGDGDHSDYHDGVDDDGNLGDLNAIPATPTAPTAPCGADTPCVSVAEGTTPPFIRVTIAGVVAGTEECDIDGSCADVNGSYDLPQFGSDETAAPPYPCLYNLAGTAESDIDKCGLHFIQVELLNSNDWDSDLVRVSLTTEAAPGYPLNGARTIICELAMSPLYSGQFSNLAIPIVGQFDAGEHEDVTPPACDWSNAVITISKICSLSTSSVGEITTMSDVRKTPVTLELNSSSQYEISYAGPTSGFLDPINVGASTRFFGNLPPGQYQLFVSNTSDDVGPVALKPAGSGCRVVGASGTGWQKKYLLPNGIVADQGPQPTDGWWVDLVVKEQSSNEQTIVVDAVANSGSAKRSIKLELDPGVYIAEIIACDAIVGGQSDGAVRLQYQTKAGKRQENFAHSEYYVGQTVEFNHSGGAVAAYIPSTKTGMRSGSVTIQIVPKSEYYNRPQDVAPIVERITSLDICLMHFNHVNWYEEGWKAGTGCGFVVNVAGQDYIVVRRSVGTDKSCGGGETLATPCIAKYPGCSLAWPTFDGKTFVGVPSSGSISFRPNAELSSIINTKLAIGDVSSVIGDQTIATILFPSL